MFSCSSVANAQRQQRCMPLELESQMRSCPGAGHDMDLLQIGEPGEGKKKIWVIARQHPGERPEAISCGLVNLNKGMPK